MTPAEIQAALSEPFGPDEVEWKPQTAKGNRALAVAYIDARCVMERLDAVVGVAGWQDSYAVLDDGNVLCKLSLNVAGEWVTKEDVGGPSDQKDVGDKRKASFSDALKRAAVKFGVGRYLYSLPHQWCDYDEQKRQFVKTPSLPQWALPRKAQPQAPQQRPQTSAAQKTQPTPEQQPKPMTGERFAERLREKDAALAHEGLCAPGELVAHVTATGVKGGWSAMPKDWKGQAIEDGIACVKQFEADRRAAHAPPALDPEKLAARIEALRIEIDDATPERLKALDAEIRAQAADLGRHASEELLRSVREKSVMAPAKGKGRKAG